ncbi:hypothetical protein VaNZ11_008184 [Volvox africanus]|uniref:EGF-like domain-containing protein n=1 Tax=Volvox africanus TaxID=51714 RepID=A0ABQ5S4G1_9CHLO|nr:hypothetical protein VaNZ11_008184 [Volvox africanus]
MNDRAALPGHFGFMLLRSQSCETIMAHISRQRLLWIALALVLQLSTGTTRTYRCSLAQAAMPRHGQASQRAIMHYAVDETSKELENGAWVHLKYDITLADHLIVLAQESSLRALRCALVPAEGLQATAGSQQRQQSQPQRQTGALHGEWDRQQPRPRAPDQQMQQSGTMLLALVLDDPEGALRWPPGAVLVGEDDLGCIPPGSDRPFAFYLRLKAWGRVHSPDYPLNPDLAEAFTATKHESKPQQQQPQPQEEREVTWATWSDVFDITETGATSIVVFEVEQVGVEHCFREARIAYRYVPPGHVDHPRRHSAGAATATFPLVAATAATTISDMPVSTGSPSTSINYSPDAADPDLSGASQSRPQTLPVGAPLTRIMHPGPRLAGLSAKDLRVSRAFLHATSPSREEAGAKAVEVAAPPVGRSSGGMASGRRLQTGALDAIATNSVLEARSGEGSASISNSAHLGYGLVSGSSSSQSGFRNNEARLGGGATGRRSAQEIADSMAMAAANAKVTAAAKIAADAESGLAIEVDVVDRTANDAIATEVGAAAAGGGTTTSTQTYRTADRVMGVNYNFSVATAREAFLPLVASASGIVSDGAGSGEGAPQALTSADVSLGCRDCFATLEAGVSFELVVLPFQEYPYMRLDYMRVSLFGQLTVHADLELKASRAASLSSQALRLLPLEHMGSLAFLAGPIPVTLSLATTLKARVSMSVGAPGVVFSGLRYSEYVELGAEFRRQWQEFRQIPMPAFDGFEIHPTQLTVPGPVSMELAIMPIFSLNLWLRTPMTFTPTILYGLLSQHTPGGPACSGLGYQVYTGMDTAVSVGGEIRIASPGGDAQRPYVLLGRPYVPWSSTVTVQPRNYPMCSACSGCIHDTRGTAGSAHWEVSVWGPCNVPCGGGNRTRRVECRQRNAAGVEKSAPDSLCSADIGLGGGPPKPAALQRCNSQACGLEVACPDSCTPEMLGNEQCDRQCMVLECGYDNGYCASQLAVASTCLDATTCADCLNSQTSCGWCASVSGAGIGGSCLPGSAAGPAAGFICMSASVTAPADTSTTAIAGSSSSSSSGDMGLWWTTQCAAVEPRLAVIRPAAAVLLAAGSVARVTWSGGTASGNVQLYLRVGDSGPLTTGLGLPADPIPNTGVFHWTLALSTAPGSDYRLVLHSTTDRTNIAVSAAFVIAPPPGPGTWLAKPWDQCSAPCGGGRRTRVVICANATATDASPVNDLYCNPVTKPPTSEICNPWHCQADCPGSDAVSCAQNSSDFLAGGPTFSPPSSSPSPPSSTSLSSCSSCSCLRRPGGLGFVCGFISAWTGEVISCDSAPEAGGAYQECCRRNGVVCDDGCTDKAQWVEVGRSECSRQCGGGIQNRNFKCMGSYNPGCGGTDEQCAKSIACPDTKCQGPDPGLLLYDCNLQPCPVYSWATGEWGACDRQCGGGSQNRNIICSCGLMNNTATSGSSSLAAWAAAPDSYCASLSRPTSQRLCNLQPCPDPPLRLLTPEPGAVLPAGAAVVNITWVGGNPYDVVMVSAALVARGLAARPVVARSGIVGRPLQWLPVGSLGLPYAVPNVGWAAWNVPAEVGSGWYMLQLASFGGVGTGGNSNDSLGVGATNAAIAAGPIAVQGTVSYVAMFLPWSPMELLTSTVQLSLRGTYGNATSAPLDLSLALLQTSRSAKAVTVTCIDVGEPLEVGVQLTPPTHTAAAVATNLSPPELPAFSVVLLNSSWSRFEAGFPGGVSAAVSGPVVSPVCGAFNDSCVVCISSNGCGYCHASGECMALGGAATGGGPAVRSCPAAHWASTEASCGADRCAALRSCATCMRVAGCGWCATTCSCSAVHPVSHRPFSPFGNGSTICSASRWLPFLLPGQTCASAPQTAGSTCPSAPFPASAKATLVALPVGGNGHGGVALANGSALAVRLSASGSAPMEDCAAAGCAPPPKGTCTAIGTASYCDCTGGWSGSLCEVPPGPCWGDQFCPVDGLCVEVMTVVVNVTTSVVAACACRPGYAFRGLVEGCVEVTQAAAQAPTSPRAPPLPPSMPSPPAPSCGLDGAGCNGHGTCGVAAPRCSCDDGWGDIYNCLQPEAVDNGWDCSCQCPTDLETCVPGSGGACRWCVSHEHSAGCVPMNRPCPIYTYIGGGRSLLAMGSVQQQRQEEEEEEVTGNGSAGNAVDAAAVTHFTNPAAVTGRPRRMGAAASTPTATAASPATAITVARARKRRLRSTDLPGRFLQQQTPSTANSSSLTSSLTSSMSASFYSWRILTLPVTGGNATIINATLPEALVTGISPGLYEFELVLKDNNGNTNSARTKVLVSQDPWSSEAPPTPSGPVAGPMSPSASIIMPAPSPVPPAPTGKLTQPMAAPLPKEATALAYSPLPGAPMPPPMPMPMPLPMPRLPSVLNTTAERYSSLASVAPSASPPRPSPVLTSFEVEVTLPIANTTLPAVRGAILQLAYNYLTVPVRFQAGMPYGSCAQGPQAALATALAYPLRLPTPNISTISCQAGSGVGGSGSVCDAVAAVQAVLMFKVDPATLLESFKTAVFRALYGPSSSNNGSMDGLCPLVEGETDASTAAPGCMVRAISTPDSSFSDCQAFVSVLLPAMDAMVQTVLNGSGSSLVIMRTQCRATMYSNGVKAPSPAPQPGPPPASPVDAGKPTYVSTGAIGDGARSSDDKRDGSGGGGGSKTVVIGVAAAGSVVLLSALLVLLLCCRRRRNQEHAAEDERTRQGTESADEVPDMPAQPMSTCQDYTASGRRHWLLFSCFRRSNHVSGSGGSWRGTRVAPEGKKLRDEGDVELAATGTALGGIDTEGSRKEGFVEEGLSVASAGGPASKASAGPAAGTDAATPIDPARSVDSDMLLMATARLPTEDSAAAAELPSGALPPGLVPPEPTILMLPPSAQTSDTSSGIRANNGAGNTSGRGAAAFAASDDGRGGRGDVSRSTSNGHVGAASSVLSRSSVKGMEHTWEVPSSWPEMVGSPPTFAATEPEMASLKMSSEPSTKAPPLASEPSVMLPAVATAALAAQPPESPLSVGEPTVGCSLSLAPATAQPKAPLSTVSSQPAAEVAAAIAAAKEPMALSSTSLTNQSVAPAPHVAPASLPVMASLISPVSAACPRLSVLPPIAGPLEHLPQLDPLMAPHSLGARLRLPVTVP